MDESLCRDSPLWCFARCSQAVIGSQAAKRQYKDTKINIIDTPWLPFFWRYSHLGTTIGLLPILDIIQIFISERNKLPHHLRFLFSLVFQSLLRVK